MPDDFDWSYDYNRLPKRKLVFRGLNTLIAALALMFFVGVALGSVAFMVWILSGAK